MLENQLILDNIDVPIWLFNIDNVLIRTNTAVSRVAGRLGETISPAENDRIFREGTFPEMRSEYVADVAPEP